jgi:hypothetical protein
VEIHADISKAIDGKSDVVDDVEPSFSVGKSPPENLDIGSEKVPGAGGLGEGTPKVCPSLVLYLRMILLN